MRKIISRYLRKAKNNRKFGNTCLYIHTLSNKEEFDVGPPLLIQRVLPSDEAGLRKLISFYIEWNVNRIYEEEESQDRVE